MMMHPVQYGRRDPNKPVRLCSEVTLAAYEVYCQVYGKQQAMIEGDCRGGFGVGELIALLYARSFPKSEWSKRVDEALSGMENLS